MRNVSLSKSSLRLGWFAYITSLVFEILHEEHPSRPAPLATVDGVVTALSFVFMILVISLVVFPLIKWVGKQLGERFPVVLMDASPSQAELPVRSRFINVFVSTFGLYCVYRAVQAGDVHINSLVFIGWFALLLLDAVNALLRERRTRINAS